MSGIDCDYVVFITVLDEKALEHTFCVYTRDRQIAHGMKETLRMAGKVIATTQKGETQCLTIRHVEFAKL